MNNSRFSVCLLYPHNTRDFVKTAHCVHCFPSISTKLHGNCIGKGDSKIWGLSYCRWILGVFFRIEDMKFAHIKRNLHTFANFKFCAWINPGD